MQSMWSKRSFVRLIAVVFVGAVALGPMVCVGHAQDDKQPEKIKRGRKYVPPKPTARVEVYVARATTGKPIPNAGVVFHLQEEKGNMELKSDMEGKAVIEVLPIGSKVRLQVIARGFQTYGEDFTVDGPEKTIQVKMQRPQEQFSIYKKNEGRVDSNAPQDQKSEPTKEPEGSKPQ